MFLAPIHETLDTKFLKLDESMDSKENIKRRFYVRALLFSFNTFVTAAFPFMGDFVNLFGSFTLIPITFVFPSMIFLKVTNLFWTALILLMKDIKEAISKTKHIYSIPVTGQRKDSQTRKEGVALVQHYSFFSTCCSNHNFCSSVDC